MAPRNPPLLPAAALLLALCACCTAQGACALLLLLQRWHAPSKPLPLASPGGGAGRRASCRSRSPPTSGTASAPVSCSAQPSSCPPGTVSGKATARTTIPTQRLWAATSSSRSACQPPPAAPAAVWRATQPAPRAAAQATEITKEMCWSWTSVPCSTAVSLSTATGLQPQGQRLSKWQQCGWCRGGVLAHLPHSLCPPVDFQRPAGGPNHPPVVTTALECCQVQIAAARLVSSSADLAGMHTLQNTTGSQAWAIQLPCPGLTTIISRRARTRPAATGGASAGAWTAAAAAVLCPVSLRTAERWVPAAFSPAVLSSAEMPQHAARLHSQLLPSCY